MTKNNNTNPPIKRSAVLQPLSREHHHVLLLAWKIRKGLEIGIEPSRMKVYIQWLDKKYLQPHVDFEERFIYPLLPAENEPIVQARAEHQQLRYYLDHLGEDEAVYLDLANLLEQHIRFEERVLFNQIQKIITPEQAAIIQANSNNERFAENESDPFWLETSFTQIKNSDHE